MENSTFSSIFDKISSNAKTNDFWESSIPAELENEITIFEGDLYLYNNIETQNNFNGKEYAAKVMYKDTISERHYSYISSEANIMRIIKGHMNLLSLFELYEEEDAVIFVSELMQGGDLYSMLKDRKRLKEWEAHYFFTEIINGLYLLHNKDIIHRDLKLENVLLDRKDIEKPIVKIADFGMTEILKDYENLNKKCGTPGYIAPEMLYNKPYNKKADIFSVGVILFTLLNGSPPFKGKTVKEILEKNKCCKFKFRRDIWENLSDEVKHLIKKMVAKDSDRRYNIEDVMSDEWVQNTCTEKLFQNSNEKILNPNTIEKILEKEETSHKKKKRKSKKKFTNEKNEDKSIDGINEVIYESKMLASPLNSLEKIIETKTNSRASGSKLYVKSISLINQSVTINNFNQDIKTIFETTDKSNTNNTTISNISANANSQSPTKKSIVRSKTDKFAENNIKESNDTVYTNNMNRYMQQYENLQEDDDNLIETTKNYTHSKTEHGSKYFTFKGSFMGSCKGSFKSSIKSLKGTFKCGSSLETMKDELDDVGYTMASDNISKLPVIKMKGIFHLNKKYSEKKKKK